MHPWITYGGRLAQTSRRRCCSSALRTRSSLKGCRLGIPGSFFMRPLRSSTLTTHRTKVRVSWHWRWSCAGSGNALFQLGELFMVRAHFMLDLVLHRAAQALARWIYDTTGKSLVFHVHTRPKRECPEKGSDETRLGREQQAPCTAGMATSHNHESDETHFQFSSPL